jgi:transcriptional regulator with GAF, ATPase, and Fis domain
VCDIRVADPTVSRRHAALEPAGRRLRVTDLGSANGTFIDGVAIAEAFLRGGEVLRVGSTAFRVDSADKASEPALPIATRFGRMIGASLEMRQLYPLCQRLAASDIGVLIEGETGTGKEVLAEALHEQGPRADKPFVVFDCSAIAPSLVESELFGHERGAFTGALTQRRGVFELAHTGTLFIDEIGELDISLQPKLLRAIERSEIRRLGSEKSVRVDVRVLAATRRDLDREIQEGRFRDDLFHRLAVARIELPPLRRRRGDVTLLGRNFCRELGGDEQALTSAQLVQWNDYAWPGNVRELRNVVERRLALGSDLSDAPVASVREVPERAAEDAPDFIDQVLALKAPLATARQRVIDEFEQRYVAQVLADHDGNVGRAAAASGVARRHFQRLRARRPK